MKSRLVLFSSHAFYRPRFETFKALCAKHELDGFIIGPSKSTHSPVYVANGIMTPASAGLKKIPSNILLYEGEPIPSVRQWRQIEKYLLRVRPHYIWVNEEPDHYLSTQILWWAWRHPKVKIIVAPAENIHGGKSLRNQLLFKFRRHFFWRRWDAVLPCSTITADSMYDWGVPIKVPIYIAYLPHLEPPNGIQPMRFDFGPVNAEEKNSSESAFIVGFAGNICEQKGWKILLAAISQLPQRFKCVLAGVGMQMAELQLFLQLSSLKGRCLYLGVLPKSELWGFYKGVDCMIVPSLTTSSCVEQFGSVTAEAMASGTPVIGSSSGAIPEVISDAGLIFTEGNIQELCDCIKKLAASLSLRAELKYKGINRFKQHFSIPAYVEKLAASFGLV